MIDINTKKLLEVSIDTVSYIILPVSQIDDVCVLLDANNIYYWIDANAISLDGEPEVTVINLGQGDNVSIVQNILDNAS